MNEEPLVKFQNIIFLFLLGIITIFFLAMLKPFFFAIFWAVLIAAIFSPLNLWLNKKVKRPALCAILTLITIILVLIVPIGIIISLLINESLNIYHSINSGGNQWIDAIKPILDSLSKNSLVERFIGDEERLVSKLVEVLKGTFDFIVQNLSALTQNTILFLVEFAVMLYALFYFLRDGADFVDTINHYLPVDKNHLDTFIREFITTARATLKVTLVIGGVQGLLGALIFYITGIEGALVWGALMIGFSVVPAVGCAIVWVPAGIIMLFMGHIWQGITILLFGVLVISAADNLLRPILLGRDIQMHSLLIFLSTLGGIGLFGFSGFVLGPVMASLFLASWNLFAEVYPRKEAKD